MPPATLTFEPIRQILSLFSQTLPEVDSPATKGAKKQTSRVAQNYRHPRMNKRIRLHRSEAAKPALAL